MDVLTAEAHAGGSAGRFRVGLALAISSATAGLPRRSTHPTSRPRAGGGWVGAVRPGAWGYFLLGKANGGGPRGHSLLRVGLAHDVVETTAVGLWRSTHPTT